MDKRAVALRTLGLLDLTNLNDDCVERDVIDLCARTEHKGANVAAVCVWSPFVALSRAELGDNGVRVATVANFPHGSTDVERAVAETRKSVADGAHEVDVVLPYTAWLAGDRDGACKLVAACKAACGDTTHLKVILETGILQTTENIIAASRDAIASGADFIKTSTGKVEVSATIAAAKAMLGVIRETDRAIGFKAAGGIRTLEDAASYLDVADKIMGPGWATPETFRFGASGLLDDLLGYTSGG
ncbi:MAG: deoxyribose-phosphate aldolase [Rhodospirillales bacterium]|jgi:deoxyribose-phosphate aldolase|nr:deoxyribose-phosphate aldolase [Rhodospirillales bacterium]